MHRFGKVAIAAALPLAVGAKALADSPHVTNVAYLDLWKNRVGDAGARVAHDDPHRDEKDRRHEHPRFQKEHLLKNAALLTTLESMAAKKKCTPAQLALAWVLAQNAPQKVEMVPIPGTTKLHRLEENIGAANVELTPDDLRELEDAAEEIQVQ